CSRASYCSATTCYPGTYNSLDVW
nr:immunoglobulin heavy chain junction region [Macaca mulatta]